MTQPHLEERYASGDGADHQLSASSSAAQLNEISRVAEELRRRLDAVLASANQPVATSQPVAGSQVETELGELFVRSQNFIDHSVEDARLRASQAIDEARATAVEVIDEAWATASLAIDEARATAVGIIDEAHRKAEALLEETRLRPAIPPEALQQLERTIDSFRRANSDLSHELEQLNSNLHPHKTANGHANLVTLVDAAQDSPQPLWIIPTPSSSEPMHGSWSRQTD